MSLLRSFMFCFAGPASTQSERGIKNSTGHHCNFSPGLCREKANSPPLARGGRKAAGGTLVHTSVAPGDADTSHASVSCGKKKLLRTPTEKVQTRQQLQKRQQRLGNTPQSFSWDFALYFAPLKHVMVEDWLLGLTGRMYFDHSSPNGNMARLITFQVLYDKRMKKKTTTAYQWASLLTSSLNANQAGTLAGLAEKQDFPKHGTYMNIGMIQIQSIPDCIPGRCWPMKKNGRLKKNPLESPLDSRKACSHGGSPLLPACSPPKTHGGASDVLS